MIEFSINLKEYPFLQQQYPGLHRKVYELLNSLTPHQVVFELRELGDSFNYQSLDEKTINKVEGLLTSLLENTDIKLSKDDLLVTYQRFLYLSYADYAIKKGLLIPEITDTDIKYYVNFNDELEIITIKAKKYSKSFRIIK